MRDKKNSVLIIVIILILLIDQLIKIYFKTNLTVGYNLSLTGNFLGLHFTQTFMSMTKLLTIGFIFLVSGFILIKMLKIEVNHRLIRNGFLLIFGSSLGCLFDIITIGNIETIIPFGLRLKTMDTLYLYYGLGTKLFNLPYILGIVGLVIVLYSLIFKFSKLKKIMKVVFSKKRN